MQAGSEMGARELCQLQINGRAEAGKLLEMAPEARQGPGVLPLHASLPPPSILLIERIFEEQVFFQNVVCSQFTVLKFENI